MRASCATWLARAARRGRRGRRQGPAHGLVPAAVDALRRRARRAALVRDDAPPPGGDRRRARASPTAPGRPTASRAGGLAQRDRSRPSTPRAARSARSSATTTCSPTGAREIGRMRRAARPAAAGAARRARAPRRSTRSSTRALHRNRVALGRARRPARACASMAEGVWEQLQPLAAPGGDAEATHAALDAARGDFHDALRRGGGDRPVLDHRGQAAPASRRREARRRAAVAARPARPPRPGALPQARAPCARAAPRVALLGSSHAAHQRRRPDLQRRGTTSRECLESLAAQTFERPRGRDGRRRLDRRQRRDRARRSPTRDPRFRLDHARPTAASARRATPASTRRPASSSPSWTPTTSLPPNAYELLLGALEQTGSDFATGNVHRLDATRHAPGALPRAARSRETRLKTHITRFRAAARRPHGLEQALAALVLGRARLPLPRGARARGHPGRSCPRTSGRVGRRASPSRLPLPRCARAATLSITQRRARAERAAATAWRRSRTVSDVPRRARARRARKRWYDESVVADDLRYYLNVLDSADDEYRALFLDARQRVPRRRRADAHLQAAAGDRPAQVAPRAPPADARAARGAALPAARSCRRRRRCAIRGRWYGDYPFRDRPRAEDPALGLPARPASSRFTRLDRRRCAGRAASCGSSGYAYIDGIGAPEPRRAAHHGHRAAAGAAPARVRLRDRRRPLPTRATCTGRTCTGSARRARSPTSTWSGFEATLDRGGCEPCAAGARDAGTSTSTVRAGRHHAPPRRASASSRRARCAPTDRRPPAVAQIARRAVAARRDRAAQVREPLGRASSEPPPSTATRSSSAATLRRPGPSLELEQLRPGATRRAATRSRSPASARHAGFAASRAAGRDVREDARGTLDRRGDRAAARAARPRAGRRPRTGARSVALALRALAADAVAARAGRRARRRRRRAGAGDGDARARRRDPRARTRAHELLLVGRAT